MMSLIRVHHPLQKWTQLCQSNKKKSSLVHAYLENSISFQLSHQIVNKSTQRFARHTGCCQRPGKGIVKQEGKLYKLPKQELELILC